LENLYEKERSKSLEDSLGCIQSFIKDIGLTWSFSFKDSLQEVTNACLYNSEDIVVASGSGKGKSHKIGCLAEAIEHYICCNRVRDSRNITISKLLDQREFQDSWLLSSLESDDIQETIEIENFISLESGEVVYVPVSLFDPEVAATRLGMMDNLDSRLCKFASNNGAAVGLSKWDSILHGLNEVIERHYESLFYQSLIGYNCETSWYYYQGKGHYQFTNKRKQAESTGGRVLVIYTPTFAGTYVAFAVFSDSDQYLVSPVGAGSSIYLELAVQRALDELIQSLVIINLGDENFKKEDSFSHSFLTSNYSLKPLINFPLDSILKIITKSNQVSSSKNKLSTKEQSNFIINKLKSSGYTPLIKAYSENKVFLYHVFVPQFDMFFMIRKGIPVAPSGEYKEAAGTY
jgi:ribosomal protein S12 methylthiotransferase accessory factor